MSHDTPIGYYSARCSVVERGEDGGHWSSEPLPRISIFVSLLERHPWGRKALSRLNMLRTLRARMALLLDARTVPNLQYRCGLAAQSDLEWIHVCSADMQQVLGSAAWADRLDYRVAEEMWRRGAEYLIHTANIAPSSKTRLASSSPSSRVPAVCATQDSQNASVSPTLPASSA